MARLTRRGTDAKATARPVTQVPPKVHPVNAPIDWQDPYADPFPPVDDVPLNERLSYLGDAGVWAQQLIEETAALARKVDKLTRKLEDPRLADSPHRPAAITQARQWDVDLQDLVRDVCWHEAHADRFWQSLTAEQRKPAAGHWQTPATTPRLIGASFLRLGTFETWPRMWRVRRAWFSDFPFLLITDMKAAGLWDWRAGPDPPDPFGGETIIDLRLAEELERRT